MIPMRYIVEGDGIIYRKVGLSDAGVRDMIRFGSVVSVFRQSVNRIQYGDVDPITHELVWKSAKVQEE